MRGLWKAHHAIQSHEAREDWRELVAHARAAGLTASAQRLVEFDETQHGWRAIDKRAARLRQAMGWSEEATS